MTNYKTKKAMLADVKAGLQVRVFQPGPFGPACQDGEVALEGPHYPASHSWYAEAKVRDGVILRAK